MASRKKIMSDETFLVDISKTQNPGVKYEIVPFILKIIIDTLVKSKDQPTYSLTSELSSQAVASFVELFFQAFHDLAGFPKEGLARISCRLFMNLRGMELSVWTSEDTVYTVFIGMTVNQVAAAVSGLSGLASTDDNYKLLLEKLNVTEYHLIFPPYQGILKQLHDE